MSLLLSLRYRGQGSNRSNSSGAPLKISISNEQIYDNWTSLVVAAAAVDAWEDIIVPPVSLLNRHWNYAHYQSLL